jgi:hypothetical protein
MAARHSSCEIFNSVQRHTTGAAQYFQEQAAVALLRRGGCWWLVRLGVSIRRNQLHRRSLHVQPRHLRPLRALAPQPQLAKSFGRENFCSFLRLVMGHRHGFVRTGRKLFEHQPCPLARIYLSSKRSLELNFGFPAHVETKLID